MPSPFTSIVVVDLQYSQSATSFSDESSFFSEELRSLVEQIRKLVARLASFRSNEHELWHRHETFSVLGGRGLGKTSFLLSLKARLEAQSDQRIKVLDNLDPTLVESNEIVLATLIGNILRATGDEKVRSHEGLRNATAALGKSLRLLAPGHASGWKELWPHPELYADELLRGARGSLELREHFYRFVKAAADALEVDTFVQPIDDVDTAFDQGWTVLETVRKYLTTPRFIPVLSGDIELYRMLVRTRQWDHLRPLVEMERTVQDQSSGGLTRYQRQIDGLEDQYILKVMPSHQRIELQSVRDRIRRAAQRKEGFIEIKDGDHKQPLQVAFAELSRSLFGWPHEVKGEDHSVLDPAMWPVAELLPRNTRMLMRFLRAISPSAPSGLTGGSQPPAASEGDRGALLMALAQIFQQSLREREFTATRLERLSYGEGIAQLGSWAYDHRNEVAELARLDPRALRELPDAESWIQVILLIQAAIYLYCRRSPGAALHFVGRAVLPTIVSGSVSSTFAAHLTPVAMRLESEEPAWLTAARLVGLHAGPRRMGTTLPASGPGYLRVGKKMNTAHRNRVLRTLAPRAQETFDGRTWWRAIGEDRGGVKAADLLPAWSTWVHRSGPAARLVARWFMVDVELIGYHFNYISLHRGLLALSEVLRLDLDDDGIIETIHESLRRAEGVTVHAPPAASGILPEPSEEDTDDDDDDGDHQASQYEGALLDAFVRWVKLVREQHTQRVRDDEAPLLPPPVIAGIFFELHDILGRQQDDLRGRAQAVGAAIERWIGAFFNVCIATELEFRRSPLRRFVSSRAVVTTLRSLDQTLEGMKRVITPEPRPRAGKPGRGKSAESSATIPSLGRDLPDTLAWLSCPVLLAGFEEQRRADLIKLLEGTPFAELYGEGSEAIWKDAWAFGSNKRESVPFDVHTILSALIMPPDGKSDDKKVEPTKPQLSHARALLGFDWPEQ